ncbi:hypothetical protein ACFCXT_33555 [Streptomyces vinaceus]|uniref:hypothetical protein n=1 Tax=Streptomyces vinaceus TaxID=1960 RepID=UPI0035D77DBC
MTTTPCPRFDGVIDSPTGSSSPDGATGLFELLVDRSPEALRRFAEDHYEVPVDLEAVRDVYALRPLSQELVSSLNAEVTLVEGVAEELVFHRRHGGRQRFDEVQGQAVVVTGLPDRVQGGLANLGLRFVDGQADHAPDDQAGGVRVERGAAQEIPEDCSGKRPDGSDRGR